jgi:hypothetical protein
VPGHRLPVCAGTSVTLNAGFCARTSVPLRAKIRYDRLIRNNAQGGGPMDEENLRKMAVAQYLQGKPPRSIYCEMERSKKWFFKWLLRYRSGTPEWYRDQPKRPRHHPNQVSSETQSLVKQVRCHLEQNRRAQVGVSAIKWEFTKLGATAPSDRTINRILKRDGLVKKNGLRPQRARVPLFHPGARSQQHPPSRLGGPTLPQKQRPLLLAQFLGPLTP